MNIIGMNVLFNLFTFHVVRENDSHPSLVTRVRVLGKPPNLTHWFHKFLKYLLCCYSV